MDSGKKVNRSIPANRKETKKALTDRARETKIINVKLRVRLIFVSERLRIRQPANTKGVNYV